jgi:hypothetical protein
MHVVTFQGAIHNGKPFQNHLLVGVTELYNDSFTFFFMKQMDA